VTRGLMVHSGLEAGQRPVMGYRRWDRFSASRRAAVLRSARSNLDAWVLGVVAARRSAPCRPASGWCAVGAAQSSGALSRRGRSAASRAGEIGGRPGLGELQVSGPLCERLPSSFNCEVDERFSRCCHAGGRRAIGHVLLLGALPLSVRVNEGSSSGKTVAGECAHRVRKRPRRPPRRGVGVSYRMRPARLVDARG